MDGDPIGGRIYGRSHSLPASLAFRHSRMPITVDRSPDRRSRNGDVKDVLAAVDDAAAARWPVAGSTRRPVKGDDYNAVLTVAQGSGNWQRVRAAAHGATPLSQLIWESRSPLSALPSFLPSREGPLYPLSNARFLISAPRRVAPRRSPPASPYRPGVPIHPVWLRSRIMLIPEYLGGYE